MVEFEAGPQALGRELAGRFAAKTQSLGDGSAEERVAESVEDQRQGRLGDLVIFMARAQLGNEVVDRFEDRVQGIAIAGEDHPRGKSAGAFAVEGIEGHVHDIARVRLAGACTLDGDRDTFGDGVGDCPDKFSLEAGGGPEMMKEVGVGPADFGSDGFKGDGLGTVGEKESPSRLDRGRAALLRAQSCASC